MKNSLLLKMTILLLIFSALSGCLWVERGDGYRYNDAGNGGNHHGKKH